MRLVIWFDGRGLGQTWIDGVDVSNYVRDVNFAVSAGEETVVTLGVLPEQLDVEVNDATVLLKKLSEPKPDLVLWRCPVCGKTVTVPHDVDSVTCDGNGMHPTISMARIGKANRRDRR